VESDPVARNFIVLIIGIVVVGFVLQYAFFRHNSPERRFTGFVVVFVGFVLAVTLINRVVF
jgi:uncharacterized membrane protein YecN with MAPEG domain